MFIKILKIISFILLCSPFYIYSQLNLIITADKDTFLTDEPIWIEATEVNNSTITQYSTELSPWFPSYCRLILTDAKGDTWSYKGVIGFRPYSPEYSGLAIKPGERQYYVNNLLDIFGISDSRHDITFVLPPGEYKLQIIHNTNYHWVENAKKEYSPNKDSFKDKKNTIKSNMIDFYVINPTGFEAMVHNKLLQEFEARIQSNQNNVNAHLSYQLVKSILNEYPMSVYSQIAFIELTSIPKSYREKDYFLEQRKRMLKANVNSIFSYYIISRIPSNEAVNIFPKILHEFPQSKATEYINNIYAKKRLATFNTN